MRWQQLTEDCWQAKCGPLHLEIVRWEGYKEPGHPDYEPESFAWAVCPDDEDKCMERAYSGGDLPSADSLASAKEQAEKSCRLHIEKMAADLESE